MSRVIFDFVVWINLADRSCVFHWLECRHLLQETRVYASRRKAGRRRKLIQGVAQAKQPTEEDAAARSPLEFLMVEERREELRRAMVTLTERDRQLLMLKYVDGLSYGEIAQRVGVTASAVQSRLHRARGLLRKRLQACGSEGTHEGRGMESDKYDRLRETGTW